MMAAPEAQKAALLAVFDRLSEKDREWILAVAGRAVKQKAWQAYLTGEIPAEEVCKIAEELSHA